MIHILDHMTRLCKTVVQFIFRRLWGVLDLPAFQQVQIIAQHPLAVHLIVAEGPCQRIRLFQCHSCRGLVRVHTEVIGQLLCCLVAAQAEQPRHKVDHIAGGPAAKTIKVILIQLHAGMPVIVEGAADHVAPVDLAAVVLGGLLHGDRVFHSFKKCQNSTSIFGHRKSGLPSSGKPLCSVLCGFIGFHRFRVGYCIRRRKFPLLLAVEPLSAGGRTELGVGADGGDEE